MNESGNSTKAGLMIALQTQDLETFTKILKETSLDLNKFVDPGGFNIFHDIAKILIKEYLVTPYLNALLNEFKVRHPPSILVDMLNSLTVKEKQTPLHIAAKNNKLVKATQKLAMEYLKLGAKPYLTDFQSQNVLHLSAFQGHVGLFVFFYSTLDFNLNDFDSNHYTALHLAVLEGHENVSNFIISVNRGYLELKDSRGYTPLHLSVFSSSYKIAKNLVMNGADRKALCNNGLTPERLAISKGNMEMLKVLKKPGMCVNPCKPPLKRLGVSRFIIFIVFCVAKIAALVLLFLPYFSYYVGSGVLALQILSFVLLIMINRKNPGYAKDNMKIPELYSKIKPEFICPYCVVKKYHTTVHCYHCDQCVRVIFKQNYDHHCPWIDNCIGENNQKLFVFFLFVLIADLSSVLMLMVFIFLGFLKSDDRYLKKFYSSEYIDYGVIVIIGFLIIMILPILFVQVNNILLKKTTYQRFAFRKTGVFSSLSSSSSIFIKDSEDWSAYTNIKDVEVVEERGCCVKNSRGYNKETRSSNINDVSVTQD